MKNSSFVIGNKRKRARRGVSLIEVLVVLVLLVLGILIIVRLYPSGFFSITSVGNAALADSLGQAAVQAQAQNAAGLPEAILPGPLDLNGSGLTALQISQLSSYDPEFNPSVQPDYSKVLDNARVISNETITVPAASGATRQSVYVVNYGPIVMPLDPAKDTAQFNGNLTINSLSWTAQPDDSAVSSFTLLNTGRPNYLVDYSAGKIGLPYATYTQNCVLTVKDAKDVVHTLYLTVPAAYPVVAGDPVNPNGPINADKTDYRDSTSKYYNGKWFDPEDTTLNYVVTQSPTAGTAPVLPTPWKAVMLYRPYQALLTGTAFGDDPYQFELLNPNIGGVNPGANIGAIGFNPLAAGGSGSGALKAQISYQTYSWKVLREDRDLPALPDGNTTVERLTLKNLKRAGDPNPDNTIYTGFVPNSNHALIILDLSTGLAVGKDPANIDPTVGEFNDEDLNGPSPNAVYSMKVIDVSYATGRITFPADLGDGVNKAHRVRIFYAGDADWTVAVQKAPSYYTLNPTDVTGGADPMLRPTEYAFDPTQKLVYFPRADAGKSVELTGTYTTTSGAATLHSFAETAAISPIVMTLGAGSYVAVNLSDTQLAAPLPGGVSNVTITAVRGLSVRAVVTWKERDRWKVHSVDTVLNRAQ
jgi:type II secretory pathway pseudopilin PulG